MRLRIVGFGLFAGGLAGVFSWVYERGRIKGISQGIQIGATLVGMFESAKEMFQVEKRE